MSCSVHAFGKNVTTSSFLLQLEHVQKLCIVLFAFFLRFIFYMYYKTVVKQEKVAIILEEFWAFGN